MARSMPGLLKFAQLLSLTPTVGDTMRHISADHSLDPWQQHNINQQIVNTGLPVSAPASRLANIGIGAAVGSQIGSTIGNIGGGLLGKLTGLDKVCQGLGAVAGGLYGNIMYNNSNPDPHHRHGKNVYTY